MMPVSSIQTNRHREEVRQAWPVTNLKYRLPVMNQSLQILNIAA